MPTGADSLPIWEIIIGLISGLGFFLFGLDQMTQSLQAVAGDKLRRVLAKLTANRWAGALTGAGVTAAVNSSSITTVLLVGFISAGAMTLEQAIPVIMGANIGSTVTAQIIAFNVTQWGVPVAAAGFFLKFLFPRKKVGIAGAMLLGLGLIFFGMHLMSQGAYPLREYPPFIEAMENLKAPLLGILAGALFTALVQSSAATTGIVIVLAAQGAISLEAGIAICFGANIGTCVTALLAAIGKPREALQAAIVHLLFNCAGVLVFVWLIPPLADLVRGVSPSDLPREIANAHTIFNVANTLMFIGFTTPFAIIVRKLAPSKPAEESIATPSHIDPVYLAAPSEALEQTRLEILDLSAHAISLIESGAHAFFDGDQSNIDDLKKRSDQTEALHHAIVNYLARLAASDLQPAQSEQLNAYLGMANYWEGVADLGGESLRELAHKRKAQTQPISPQRQEALSAIQEKIVKGLKDIRGSLETSDPAPAKAVIDAQPEVRMLLQQSRDALQASLAKRESARLVIYLLENDFLEIQKQLYSLAKRLGRIELSHG